MRPIAFDTNILAYAAGLRQTDADEAKVRMAGLLVDDAMANEAVALPVQTCLELHNLLVRKRRYTRAQAERVVEEYSDSTRVIATDFDLMRIAFALAEAHDLQTYDAVILAAAASAGCEVLYSEDMQDGFEWGGVTVINPFAR